MNSENNQLVLICGSSGTGKSASLRDIKNQDKWIYLGTEAGKHLPFKANFKGIRVEDPLRVLDAFDYGIANPDKIEGIIIDSITFLMEMYESKYVLNAADTRKMWGEYNQFFKKILQDKVIKFPNSVIITAHTQEVYDEQLQAFKTSVPVKGALKNISVEAFFSTIVATKKVDIATLERLLCNGESSTAEQLHELSGGLLNVTEDEYDLGFKYCFQTRPTKETLNERIRSPLGLFSKNQTYMDNNAQILIDHLNKFYQGE